MNRMIKNPHKIEVDYKRVIHLSKSSRWRHKRIYRLWIIQNGRCCYCNSIMWVRYFHKKGKPGKLATLEHKKPLSKGGVHGNWSNHAASCKHCNTTRRSFPHWLFKVLINGKPNNVNKFAHRRAELIKFRRATKHFLYNFSFSFRGHKTL